MYRRTRLIFLSALLLGTLVLAGAWANGNEHTDVRPWLPFEPAEELIYEGEFTRALLRGVNVAEIRFKVERETDVIKAGPINDNEPAGKLHFKAEVESKGLLQKLFGLHFHQDIESTVEPQTFSVLQTLKLDEQGNRLRASKAIFDRDAGKVVWTERDLHNLNRAPRVVTSDLNGTVQDIASAVYFLRTQTLVPGKSFEIAVSDSGKIYKVPIRVLERKQMKTVLGQVPTVRVDADAFGEGRLIEGPGSLSIWFTDDARRIPVKAHINNELGTLDIKLKKVTTAAKTKDS